MYLSCKAHSNSKGISLKALVDKGSNRIIFAESDVDFVDVLFSFLTMPMGTVVRLTRNQPPTGEIGCMNNLYESVTNLDVQRLHNEACKTMLLQPKSEAETHCMSLELKIDGGKPKKYVCSPCFKKDNLLSHYSNALCSCGGRFNLECYLTLDGRDRGVFARGLTRFIISDELQVMLPSTEACFSLLSKLGVMDGSTIEERTFNVGVDEVLNLLKCSLVSTTALTEALLKHKLVPDQSGEENFDQGTSIQSQRGEALNTDRKVCVKLFFSKSKRMVCYAEAGQDFVDLLFSFLTLPLGYIAKKMHGISSKGCINHLYKSVLDLDTEQSLKSDEHKEMLVSPKLAHGFGYANQLLDIEEASNQLYYYVPYTDRLTTDEKVIPSRYSFSVVTAIHPKSHNNEATSSGGFVKGPALFTITDSLIITPISPASGISILNKLKTPFSDVEECVVHVGNEEALRLLVATFVLESALTNAFNLRVPKQE